MSRRRKDPLRVLSSDERSELARVSRSQHASAAQVARATALLAVADGQSCLAAARRAGRRDGDTVAAWAARFNREGLAAVVPRHGGGPPVRYAAQQQRRILAEAERFVPFVGALDDILCVQAERVVGNDNTVRYEGRVLQIPEQRHR